MLKQQASQQVPGLPGHYSSLELIGVGASGRVFRAHDSVRNLDLALKVVGGEEIVWLRREFDTLRQIRHENLMQVFDWASLPSGGAYYTMELLDGGDWGARMGKPQDPAEVRRVLVSVLRGLAHLHSHGEFHGDLKPGNVLLGRGGLVKLGDVGMGGAEATSAGLSGTPGYAAPELWEGARADIQADLYSAAVLAYEALTGQHPFAGRTIREVVSGQIVGWVASTASHGVSVPVDLERAVMRALDRNPGMRPASADEFMEGLNVENRIGEILGGRFCGRDAELNQATCLFNSSDPEAARLLLVTGSSQVGTSTFLAELSHRLIARGAISSGLDRSPNTSPWDALAGTARRLGMERPATGDRRLSAIAEFLWARSEGSPLFIWADPAEDEADGVVDTFASLARFLWALCVERGESRPVIFAIATVERGDDKAQFIEHIPLHPMTVGEVGQLIGGMLGRAQLQPEFTKRVHSLTGGVPGAVSAILQDLIQKKVLDRRDGCWVFRELQELQTLEMPDGGSRWGVAWEHLKSDEREAIRALAILGSGVPNGRVPRFGEESEPTDMLRGLKLKGWVEMKGGRWVLISEDVRRAALRKSTSEEMRSTGLFLLGCQADIVEKEDRADLLVTYAPSQHALAEESWAAECSTERGAYRQAAKRLRACIELARTLGEKSAEREASLSLARALNHLGLTSEAQSQLLDAKTWPRDATPDVLMAEREHVLGVCERSLGNVDAARQHLITATKLAEQLEAKTLAARSQADLAEIEWRHGDDIARARAIETIRAALAAAVEGRALTDEVAALTYQLGAALIISGQRESAKDVLRNGLKLNCSAYWKMRLMNANSSAAYYLGKFDEALESVDSAWRIAEQISADYLKPRILFNRAGVFYALGRIQEVLGDDLLAAQWALRIGSVGDLTTACNGAAIALILLGRYDEAIEQARRGELAATQLGDRGEQAISLALQAQALLQIGDFRTSERLIHEGLDLVGKWSLAKGTPPRLLWLLGKVLVARGDLSNAESVLVEAEQQLLKSKDWEDLPGVQIELNLLHTRQGGGGEALGRLRTITERAKVESALIVQLYASVAMGEIVVDFGIDDPEVAGILMAALERAERSGIADMIWRMSYYLGIILAQRGDILGAQSRFRQSLSAVRGIADRLSRDHRRFYLDSPHVASALSRIAPRSTAA